MPGWFKPPRSRWGLNGQLVHSVWWSSRQRRRPRATSEETGEQHRDKPTKWKTTAADNKRSRIFEKQKQRQIFHEAIWLNRTACSSSWKKLKSVTAYAKNTAGFERHSGKLKHRMTLMTQLHFLALVLPSVNLLLSVNKLNFFSILMSKNNVAVKITSKTTMLKTTMLKTTRYHTHQHKTSSKKIFTERAVENVFCLRFWLD